MKNMIFFMMVVLMGCTEVENVSSECIPSEAIGQNTTKAQDEALLQKVYGEILKLSESVKCEDDANWRFTPIGEKACGGPNSYIAYHNRIDTECFLKKVEYYTSQTKLFNSKHGVVSDCMLVSPPNSIKCDNNKPVFVY
jgi:hypothetical protein